MIICFSTPQALQQLFRLQLFSFIQKTFSPTPNLKRGQGLCILYERLQWEIIKLLAFYMTLYFISILPFYLQNCKVITFEQNWKIIWKMKYLISQVTFIFLTQIYSNMNFSTSLSNFNTRFSWHFEINLCQLLLQDYFL